jgi:fluoride ion exporter CrcB/FEX
MVATEFIPNIVYVWLLNGLIASIGTHAHYLYLVKKERDKFTWTTVLINFGVSLFIGNLVANLWVLEGKHHIATMLITGFSVYEIFDILENKVPKLFAAMFPNSLK